MREGRCGVERMKKKEKKKNERSDNEDGVGRCEEKKKKKERYLVYWGLFYFCAIFKLKLNCHLRIGCRKSWILQPIHIEVKFY
jgi:hypothetical protein